LEHRYRGIFELRSLEKVGRRHPKRAGKVHEKLRSNTLSAGLERLEAAHGDIRASRERCAFHSKLNAAQANPSADEHIDFVKLSHNASNKRNTRLRRVVKQRSVEFGSVTMAIFRRGGRRPSKSAAPERL
jgi:hypothetical protein